MKLFAPGHPWSKYTVTHSAVARRSVASQLFTGFSSMHGGSLRGARDPRGSMRHTLLKILKCRAETTRQELHTRPQPNSIRTSQAVNISVQQFIRKIRACVPMILLQSFVCFFKYFTLSLLLSPSFAFLSLCRIYDISLAKECSVYNI